MCSAASTPHRERCPYFDKLIGVPICLRFCRWPSGVTAALFLCVCACVSMLHNINILPTSSWPPSSLLLPYPSTPRVSALRTLCIPCTQEQKALTHVPHGSTYPLLIELFTNWSKYALFNRAHVIFLSDPAREYKERR